MSDSRRINQKSAGLPILPKGPPAAATPEARGPSKRKAPSKASRMTVKDVVMQIFNNFTGGGNTASGPPTGRGGPDTVPGGDK